MNGRVAREQRRPDDALLTAALRETGLHELTRGDVEKALHDIGIEPERLTYHETSLFYEALRAAGRRAVAVPAGGGNAAQNGHHPAAAGPADDAPPPAAPASAFPVEQLPGPAAAYVLKLAEGGLPLEFLGPAALAVLAGAAGGEKVLELIPGAWVEPLVLWFAIVGDPGSGKSPAIRNLRAPLAELEVEWAAEHEEAMRKWDSLPLEAQSKSDAPTRRRAIVSNVTLERLAGLLNENPAGVLLVADELRAVIAGLGQYKRSGSADRAGFLSLWPADSITVDRASDRRGKNIFVPRPIVSVIGGVQPGLLAIFDGDDGLRDRWLLSQFADTIPADVDLVDAGAELEGWREVVRGVAAHRNLRRTLRLTPDGRAHFMSGRRRLLEVVADVERPSHVRSWASKAPSHLGRLALLLAVVAGGIEVTRSDVEAAELLVDYFLDQIAALPLSRANLMVPQAQRDQDQAVDQLAAFARRQTSHQTTLRDVWRANVGGVRTRAEVDRLVTRYEETFPRCVKREAVSGGQRVTIFAPGYQPRGEAS